MSKHKLTLEFLEPFRMNEWFSKEDRIAKTTSWMRGQAFARWHKINESEGKPFITGTDIRAGLLREIEALLVRNKGIWNDVPCCPGEFNTKTEKPKHLRQRPTLEWKQSKDLCTYPDICPLCYFLGRFDDAGKKAKERKYPIENYHIHFGNLAPDIDSCAQKDIGDERILNRIDPVTGKAQDFFKAWEITEPKIWNFSGFIHVHDNIPEEKRTALLSLLKAASAFTGVLCGASCRLIFDDTPILGGQSDGKTPNPEKKLQKDQGNDTDAKASALAEILAGAFVRGDSARHLRLLADAVREIRRLAPGNVNLPTGPLDDKGKPSKHFLWDKEVSGETIRSKLEEQSGIDAVKKNWPAFWESLGQKLYEKCKENDPALERLRSLGEAAFSKIPKIIRKHVPETRIKGGFTHEWIFTGQLRALTPFHFGVETKSGSQNSQPILFYPDGHFRFPHSALRGALRRDLNHATDGMGCVVELGPEHPCLCPVCATLRNINLRDSKSHVALSPATRQRIRVDHYLGIVNEGSLFDVDLGIEGITFPFIMRYRGGEKIPRELETVLAWWNTECLFIGGDAGVGKGCFKLENLKACIWELAESQARNDYVINTGYRGKEIEIFNTLPSKAVIHDIDTLSMRTEPRYQAVKWSIQFKSPLLTGDPIRATLEGGANSVFYKKPVLEPGKTEPDWKWAIKAESARGLVRTAFGRQHATLLDQIHQDCDCILCAGFGSEHHEGKIRFEDLMPVYAPEEHRMDHVAVSKVDSGVVDKYDDLPLVAPDCNPLAFEGLFWVHRDIENDIEVRKNLIAALKDIRDGLYPFGANGGTGYGWVGGITIESAPAWLKEPLSLMPPDKQKEAIEIVSSPVDGTARISEAACPPLPALNFKSTALYYPHYFLPLGEQPAKKIRRPVSHTHIDKTRYTGRLTCVLTTKTPLIIPDTRSANTMNPPAGAHDEHKSFRFFRLNDVPMIPGSELRGMASTVFEALTGSCFRVMAQKSHLSWRISAEDAKNYLAGRIQEKKGQQVMIPYELFKLPFYAGPDPRACFSMDEIEGKSQVKLWVKRYKHEPEKASDSYKDGWQKIQNTLLKKDNTGNYNVSFSFNDETHSVPISIQNTDPGNDPTGKRISCWIKIKRSPVFEASISKPVPDSGWVQESGYLKVTGPNKVEVDTSSPPDPSLPNCESHWSDVYIDHKGIKPPKGQRFYKCKANGTTYKVDKWCEAFLVKKEKEAAIPINEKALKRYQLVMASYQENPQAPPPIFRSLPVLNYQKKEGLKKNELVFYRKLAQGETSVSEIIPVKISRTADILPIAGHFTGDQAAFLPCAHVCVEECDTCHARTCKHLPLYREGAAINGLCPACHVFGSTGYRGRVRFGFARLTNTAKFCHDGPAPEDHAVTLPLLERPRLTFAMPNEKAKIPGRKFYIHHQGWKQVVEDKINPIDKVSIGPKANNRTVEPLADGNQFDFEVFFENLDDWELGLLIQTLELEPGLSHKIGMAKALGFGSVDISIRRIDIRNQDRWEVLSDKQTLIDKGRQWLVQSLSQGKKAPADPDVAWHELPHVKDLRKLLQYIGDDQIKVSYPRLKKVNEDDLPAYDDMKKDKNFRAATLLASPWKPWSDQATGSIDFFPDNKPFGFIKRDDGQGSIHFLKDQIQTADQKLKKGDKVRFCIGSNEKGPTALNIKRFNGA